MSKYFPGIYLESNPELIKTKFTSLIEYKQAKVEPNYTALILLSRILPNELIKIIIQLSNETNKEREKEQISYFVVNRLYDAIEEGELNKFKRIYDEEYINNQNIINTFNYPEYGCGRVWTDYDYCTCEEREIEKRFRYIYTKQCNCANGKRYLAFIELYTKSYNYIRIPHLKKKNETRISRNKNKKNMQNNVYQDMLDYIINSGPIDMSFTGLIYN